MTEDQASVDAYAPGDMAARVEAGGVAKANLDIATILALAVLAGAFIALGANFATIVLTDTGVGYGLSRLAGGLVFSLGLILVLVGGAELFTGNLLMVMAWTSGKVSTLGLLRNWVLVYIGNFIGALATAAGVYLSRQWAFAGYQVGATALYDRPRQSSVRLSCGLHARTFLQCAGLSRRLAEFQCADHHGQDPGDHPADYRLCGRRL